VLLETPIVVRVELGSISMTAREWARLGPGDVIETSQRIAEPVVLRVAGREVARGELVNVDGQVGVRIQKLYDGS
jgi:flagellar motor switch protein FliM